MRLQGQAERLGVGSHYRLLERQADTADLPPVRIVDMRQELKAGNPSLFSRALQQALQETLDAHQQAILFLNRRGEATFVFCRDCGWVARCPRCGIPLTHHPGKQALLCHRCGYRRAATCRLASDARPLRRWHAARPGGAVQLSLPRRCAWDYDATRAWRAPMLLAHFAGHRRRPDRDADDQGPGPAAVTGGVSPPTSHIPDFRASERTFQVLTQVAGRAGRGLLAGRVILQTYHPDHPAIVAASRHDYDAFFEQEVEGRRQLGYPPFQRLTRLVYRHPDPDRAQINASGNPRRALDEQGDPADLIGPAPCFFERLRGDYRWQVVLRSFEPGPLIPPDLPQGWVVDVDPVTALARRPTEGGDPDGPFCPLTPSHLPPTTWHLRPYGEGAHTPSRGGPNVPRSVGEEGSGEGAKAPARLANAPRGPMGRVARLVTPPGVSR
jgi:primosomal protein N' (replication factor Y)